ncbi:cell wall-binding repeat-containing protein [Cytobacillus purgationiresistens]|uniref:Cell wall-binding protein n=1 Tax=Cytobacillus purgationiresistens TaxID=863449 RepID=A0ABU0AC80_9BACI|nr:cell wall-binding repeat-containing protein [Cytobacillus purgationiresistens]MDQ0268861.1 putative cell wall-binding protein [Cytobacillus purgationiresistens]
MRFFNKIILITFITFISSIFLLDESFTKAATSLTYKGKVNYQVSNTYTFSTTAKGTLTVKDQTENNPIEYYITSPDNVIYVSGDVIPPGTYTISFHSGEEAFINYNITLSGLSFSDSSSTVLPTMNISKPDYYLRLTKGALDTTVTGSTNATIASVTQFNGNPIVIENNFSKKVNVGFGHNFVDFYAELNQNSILDSRQVVSPGIKRLGGNSRYEVSANVSKELSSWGFNSSTVIIANGEAYGDIIPAVNLAVKEQAPILVTPSDALPNAVKSEIQRLKPSNAIILGGVLSVTNEVENELKQLGIKSIERIAGDSRYTNAVDTAKRIVDESTDTAIVVNGNAIGDMLSVASVAGQRKIPILLTGNADKLHSSVDNYLSQNPQIKNIVIVGGPLSVSENAEAKLATYANVDRINGNSRFEISVNVANYFMVTTNKFVITNGMNYPDGMIGAPLAAMRGYHILLTQPESLPNVVDSYLVANKSNLDNVYILGGPLSVSNEIEQRINSLIK